MRGHAEAPHKAPQAARPSCLHFCKYRSPVSPLECALTESLTTAHSKELTGSANSFRMRSSTKTPGGGSRLLPPSRPPFTPKETHFVPPASSRLSRQDGGAAKVAQPRISSPLPSLYFHELTNCTICNSFHFIAMQLYPGVWGSPSRTDRWSLFSSLLLEVDPCQRRGILPARGNGAFTQGGGLWLWRLRSMRRMESASWR